MPRTKRPATPSVTVQAAVYFRDHWLCHLCRRPVILHHALKHLQVLVRTELPSAPLAYWDAHWRRDAAPLLDELAASIDHVEAFARGGAHDIGNFATVCARCNARKSTKSKAAYLAEAAPWKVKGKHGEPTEWDGLSALFLVLARAARGHLSKTERDWCDAIEQRIGRAS